MKKKLALFFGLILFAQIKAQNTFEWQSVAGEVNEESLGDSLGASWVRYGLIFLVVAAMAVWILYVAGLWGMLKEVWGSKQEKMPVSTIRRYALPVHEGSRTDLSVYSSDRQRTWLQAAGYPGEKREEVRGKRKEERQRGK